MPLFKKRQDDDSSADDARPPSRVLSQSEILDRLDEEIFRADRYQRKLVVVSLKSQHLSPAQPNANETAQAAEAVRERLRFCDVIGVLDDGSLLALLPETDTNSARVVAHRLAADLTLISAGASRRNWLAGTSTFPEDGSDPPAMILAAQNRASH